MIRVRIGHYQRIGLGAWLERCNFTKAALLIGQCSYWTLCSERGAKTRGRACSVERKRLLKLHREVVVLHDDHHLGGPQ